MKLGYVCTSYNDASYVRAAVTSLHAGGRWSDVRVVVVDNGSRPDQVAMLDAMIDEFPAVLLVKNPANDGYFTGLNLGLRHLREVDPDVEYCVVGNCDLEFPRDFVDTVERCREVFHKWAVVSPDIVTPSGVHQNPHVLKPIGFLRRLVWDLRFLSYDASLLIRKVAILTRPVTIRAELSPKSVLHLTPGPIDQGYGACYLLGPLFFRHFSGLCSPTFFFQEEFFLGEQLKTIGQSTYYDPRFVVLHTNQPAMDRLPSRRHWEISRAAHRLYKQYLKMSPTEKAEMIGAWIRPTS